MVRLEQENERFRVVDIVTQKIDAANSASFKVEILKSLPRNNETLIIDLSQVEFVDSSGLGALISILKNIPHTEALILCGLTQSVERLFALTKMNTAFSITKNKVEAIKRVQ